LRTMPRNGSKKGKKESKNAKSSHGTANKVGKDHAKNGDETELAVDPRDPNYEDPEQETETKAEAEEDAMPAGVTKDTLEAGDGTTFPKTGDKLKMHYVGTLKAGGKKFDSSRDRGDFFEFTIGVGQVIKGWDEGVSRMSLGERAVLNISPEFGYGDRGAGADIPGGADLVFDVELTGIGDNMSTNLSQSTYRPFAHKMAFTDKLEKWKASSLSKYDTKAEFKAKKDAKTTDRAGFEAHLTKEVDSSVAGVNFHPEPSA